MLEELIKDAVEQFNDRLKNDPKLQESMKDKKRTVEIEITDSETFNFLLENGEVKNFEMGKIEQPDIKIITDSNTLSQILKKEINPLKAYISKQIQVKASLMDLLTIKNLLGS
jgi:putative sterol carrier protein